MSDLRQSEKYGQFMKKIGWKVAEYKVLSIKYKAYVRKLPFLPFSIIKVQRPAIVSSAVLDKLDKLAKNHHALFIKLEPQQCNNLTIQPFDQSQGKQLNNHGYKLDRSPLLPTKTLQIDLTQSENQIFSQFTKDGRYEIRKAGKNKLRMVTQSGKLSAPILNNQTSTDEGEFWVMGRGWGKWMRKLFHPYPHNLAHNSQLTTRPLIDDFISLWHKSAWVRGFWIPIKKQIKSLWEAFGEDAFLITVWKDILRASEASREVINVSSRLPRLNQGRSNNKLITGALVIIHEKSASYFYAASTPTGRQLSAPSLVVWEAIKLAKQKGCQSFDFEGIYDERFPNKSWLGFTHFKKSFGGQELEYPGCFTKFYNPLKLFF